MHQIGSESEFRLRYKILSIMFKTIYNKIRANVEAENILHAERSSEGLIKAELQLSMALRYMAGGRYVDHADMHGVEKNTVYKCLRNASKAINKHFNCMMVFSYANKEECDKLAEGF